MRESEENIERRGSGSLGLRLQEAASRDGSLNPGSLNSEASQLLRHLWIVHDEAAGVLWKLRSALSLARTLLRTDESLCLGGGRRRELLNKRIDLEGIPQQLEAACGSIAEAEKQFTSLIVFHAHCNLVSFVKVRHAKCQVGCDLLGILRTLRDLIVSLVHVAGSGGSEMTNEIISLSCLFNTFLEASWSGEEGRCAGGEKDARVLAQVNSALRNDSPFLRLGLKPLTAGGLVECWADRRASVAGPAFARLIHTGQRDFGGYFAEEESALSPFISKLLERPELLRGPHKPTKEKLALLFHEVLWGVVGEMAEDLLLWNLNSTALPAEFLPLALRPTATIVAYRDAVLGHKTAQVKSGQASVMIPAFESVVGALETFSLLTAWDEEMLRGFEMASGMKRPEHVSLRTDLSPSDWATEVGEKFGSVASATLGLIEGKGGGAEEEALSDEAAGLFRLEATLSYFRTWVFKRTKGWLNGWAIPQFLACAERDAALLVALLRNHNRLLVTKQLFLCSENLSVRLNAKYRQQCGDDLATAIQLLHETPNELLAAVGPVCVTLSIATLQSSMPSGSHWRSLGQEAHSEKPSSYVQIFIDRVIEPVTKASVILLPPLVQEAMGKEVIEAACDAWLQLIQQKRIRFSEWGAVQLLRDFLGLREWLKCESGLEESALRVILALECLKRLEGVAYLLLRSPGDILGVGKGRKSRKVRPSTGSIHSSPAASCEGDDEIPAEMYVPNQELWLQLRLRRNLFPCCS